MPDFDFAEIIEYLEEKGLSKFQRFFIVVFWYFLIHDFFSDILESKI
jgi:hypothetical protein